MPQKAKQRCRVGVARLFKQLREGFYAVQDPEAVAGMARPAWFTRRIANNGRPSAGLVQPALKRLLDNVLPAFYREIFTIWLYYLRNYLRRTRLSTPLSMYCLLSRCFFCYWPSFGRPQSVLDSLSSKR
jgi:hypothetical protein